jgi:arsenate reductase (glutaredoxin)
VDVLSVLSIAIFIQEPLYDGILTKPMSIQVYGIPNCGTCKKALAWLNNHGVAYEFINTKESPPTASMVESWVKTLGSKPMRNTSGQSYRALGSSKDDWSDEQWVDAFAADSMLLKRPLFVKDDVAVLVGFRDTDEVIRAKLGLG